MMDLGGKQDLDSLLASWPAPSPWKGDDAAEQDEEKKWEARAGAVVEKAVARKAGSATLQDARERPATSEVDEALLAAPALAPEPGETASGPGEKKMSEEKAPASTSTPVPSEAAPPAERKRTSLKEIAARVSQAGARPSTPGTPPPSSVAPLSRPAASTPLPRPVEAAKDDSGVIDLNVVRKATAQQVAAAEKAKPATAGLFEDEGTVESAVNPAETPAPARVAKVAVIESRRKDRTGMIAGGVIAALGIAAAVTLMVRKSPPPQVAVHDAPPPVVATAAVPERKAPAGQATVAAAEPAPSASAEAAADSKPGDTPRVAVVTGPGPAASPGASSPAATVAVAAAPPKPAGSSGDLQSEMARAVGKDGAKPDQAGTASPQPAGGGLPQNQNIPEAPSQGAVQASVSAVMGGAKACVAGADDVSRANVTFSSLGTVSSVSVTGWAAAHGKSACIQAALKAAKVGPFSRSSYTFPVTIRP